ncbi:MAG: serine/threonine-protein kinase [Acidobacteriota bacterium]
MSVLERIRRLRGAVGPGRRRSRDGAGDESTQSRWGRVTEVVDGALRRPDPRDRAAFLRAACGGDRDLRREVEDLLRFEGADPGILERPLLGERRREGGTQTPAVLRPGQTVGPYTVEALLGDGGMGQVVLARDDELDRPVALKVLRGDRVSADSLRRFEAERRILARLQHPAIARIFGAGHLDGPPGQGGLPYFTMEPVDGRPIDEHCDAEALGIEARLGLLLQVLDALDEAHRHLVVHRDLKPSNVLVTRDGRPKLLDFGVAKELDPPSGNGGDAATHTGHQPLTPAWASPEQVRGRPVGVATDVYGAGLLLYRLLCGHPPYVLDGDAFENARRICEDDPPSPSSRAGVALDVWRDGAVETLGPNVLAAARGTDPRGLARRLRGDLDAVVARALAKDPGNRYRSAAGLATDLRRHLAGLPVRARRRTAAYRISKFLRRHRRSSAAAAVLGLTAATALTVHLDGQRRLRGARQQERLAEVTARQAERQAEAVTAFARTLVLTTDPDASAGRPMTPREILRRGGEQARSQLADQPEMLAHQLEALGLAYHALGDIDEALGLFEDALRLRRRVYGRGDHPLVARALNNLAATVRRSGDRRRAERLYRLALGMKRRLGQGDDELARVESNLAGLLTFRGELGEAEAFYRRLLAVRREDPEGDPRELASSLRSLGTVLFLAGRQGEAGDLLAEALDLRRRHDGDDSLRTAAVWSSLGRVHHAEGRLPDAQDALERALGIRVHRLGGGHLHVALSRKDLAAVLFDQGDDEGAQALWDDALAVLRAKKPADAWELADADSREGARLVAQGHRDKGLAKLRRAYETLRRTRGDDAIYTREARRRLLAALPPDAVPPDEIQPDEGAHR